MRYPTNSDLLSTVALVGIYSDEGERRSKLHTYVRYRGLCFKRKDSTFEYDGCDHGNCPDSSYSILSVQIVSKWAHTTKSMKCDNLQSEVSYNTVKHSSTNTFRVRQSSLRGSEVVSETKLDWKDGQTLTPRVAKAKMTKRAYGTQRHWQQKRIH